MLIQGRNTASSKQVGPPTFCDARLLAHHRTVPSAPVAESEELIRLERPQGLSLVTQAEKEPRTVGGSAFPTCSL